MKRTTYTSSPVVPITGGIGTVAVALAAAAICPPLLPFAFLFAPMFCRAAQRGFGEDIDRVSGDQPERIAEQWRRTRKAGERGIDVSNTLYSGGAFFDLPVTRTYRFELDDNDE